MTTDVYDPDFFAAYLSCAVRCRAGRRSGVMAGAIGPVARSGEPAGAESRMRPRLVRPMGARSGLATSLVLAVDVAKMLTRARAMTGDAAIEFREMDLEHARFEAGAFDRSSSLAFHYLADLDRLLAGIGDGLRPRSGTLVFSVEHPVFTRRPAAVDHR